MIHLASLETTTLVLPITPTATCVIRAQPGQTAPAPANRRASTRAKNQPQFLAQSPHGGILFSAYSKNCRVYHIKGWLIYR